MSGPQVTIRLNKDGFKLLRAETKPKVLRLLDKIAFEIAASAIRKVRVDTGATKASIYVEGASGNNKKNWATTQARSKAIAEASGKRQDIWYTPPPTVDDEFTRIIGASTWYAIIVELVHGAFLVPAAYAARKKAQDAFSNLFD